MEDVVSSHFFSLQMYLMVYNLFKLERIVALFLDLHQHLYQIINYANIADTELLKSADFRALYIVQPYTMNIKLKGL